MSLINDALKRASKSDKDRPVPGDVPPLMQPVAPRPRGQSSWLLAAIAAAMFGLVVTGWVLWKGLAARPPADGYVSVQPAQTVASDPPRPPQPAPILQQSQASAVVAAPVPAQDDFPTNLTVKAIFYSKTNPRALLNGTMVETGDKIDGVLVTGIMADRVFVDWKGKTKELMLGAPQN
jgi:hypothetical protein